MTDLSGCCNITVRYENDNPITHPREGTVVTISAEQSTETASAPPRRGILAAVAIGVGLIFTAPLMLSSTDLHSWATSGRGLGLAVAIGWAVPVGLDLAAVVCLAMKLLRTLHGQKGGVFGLLAWTFIAASGFAQYSHGRELIAAGGARDVWWAMPAFAALGPILLDAVLHQWRQWRKLDLGHVRKGATGFGQSWIVAPVETARAWLWSRRANLVDPNAAVDFVRNYDALRKMSAQDALRYALADLRSTDLHEARKLLQRMRLRVAQDDVDAVDAQLREKLLAQVAQVKNARAAQDARTAQGVTIPPLRRVRSEKSQVARGAQEVAQDDQRAAALRDGAALVHAQTHSIRAAAQEVDLPESTLRAHINANKKAEAARSNGTAHLRVAQ